MSWGENERAIVDVKRQEEEEGRNFCVVNVFLFIFL